MVEQNPFDQKQNPVFTQSKDKNETDPGVRTAVIRTVISLSVLIIVILAIILSIKFVPQFFGSFSNLGSTIKGWFSAREALVLTITPKKVVNYAPATVAINHRGKITGEQGSYSFTYNCVQDFRFEVSTGTSTKNISLPCSKPIYRTDGEPFVIIPFYTKNVAVEVPINVSYTPMGSTTARLSSTSTVSVIAKTSTSTTPTTPTTPGTTTPTKPTTQNPYPGTGAQPVHTGPADLTISLISARVIDPATNRFQIQFRVINNGGQSTGPWQFVANLPSAQTPYFESQVQAGLIPGNGMTYTLGFNANRGASQAQISVDPRNQVTEKTKANNVLIVPVQTY